MELGHIKDKSILDDLRIQTKILSRCSKCGKLFQIFNFNPASAYACKACGGRLVREKGSAQALPTARAPQAALEPLPTPPALPPPPPAPPARQDSEGTIALAQSLVPDDLDDHTLLGLGTGAPARREGATPPPEAGAAAPAPRREGPALPPEVFAAAQDPKRAFGKYVLIKELGRGGTAMVYKAWDTSLSQYVAVKVMRAEEAETVSFEPGAEIHDFQREARLAARLHHPNIIRIYELGRVGDKNYISMDLMEGPTLFELIHGGKFRNTETKFHATPEKFLRALRDVARAVHYAHTQSPPVIHRDLKPQNVMTDARGMPQVVDFGLAKETGIGKGETVTGVVKGTPSYMAPEQAEGRSRDVDARTDVYGLGAIMYEILTGRPPFSGDNVRMVLNDIVNKLPERPNDIITRAWQERHPSQTGSQSPTKTTTTHWLFSTTRRFKAGPPRVPRKLETICLKALEKRKADRYATAKDLSDDVERVLQNLEIEAREPGTVRKAVRKIRGHPLLSGIVGAVLLAAGVAAVAVSLSRRNQKGSVEQIVNIAAEHRKAEDWPALRNDVANLRKIDPGNSWIGRFEADLSHHQAELERRRREWEGTAGRLGREPLPKVLDDLRPGYRGAGELKAEFWDKLERGLLGLQTACVNEAIGLVAPGPNPGWLDEKARTAARSCRDLASHLLALDGDPDYPFQPDPMLEPLAQNLDRLLGYRGTWGLRANVAPFAEMVVRRGGKEVARDFTPLGMPGLEVADGYTLEFSWPSRDAARKKAIQEVKGLRHGATVVVDGDVSKPEIRIVD